MFNAIKSRGILFLLLLVFNSSPALAADSYQAVFLKAQNAMALGDIAKAEELFLSIPKPEDTSLDDGSFVSSRMILARFHFGQERYDKAMELCREVLSVYPHNAEVKNFVAAIERVAKPAYVKLFEDTVKFMPLLLKGSIMTLVLVFFTMCVSPFGGLI
ncbi:MAG: tetratricopeptide repeat protein, partial [Desulfonatronovibrio sp.]